MTKNTVDKICLFIDKIPEFPYFILALTYTLYHPEKPLITHIFSTAFIFMILTLTVGAALKVMFKTKRPKNHYRMPILKYDFPSLHSLISIGAIAFLYYVDWKYSLIMIPFGLAYIYSRLRLGVHTIEGILGGVAIGLLIGVFSGAYLLKNLHLSQNLEELFTILFYILPALATVLRLKTKTKADEEFW